MNEMHWLPLPFEEAPESFKANGTLYRLNHRESWGYVNVKTRKFLKLEEMAKLTDENGNRFFGKPAVK